MIWYNAQFSWLIFKYSFKVREDKNESQGPAVTTVKDVVIQYSTQQELEKVMALKVIFTENAFNCIITSLILLRLSRYQMQVKSLELSGSNTTTKRLVIESLFESFSNFITFVGKLNISRYSRGLDLIITQLLLLFCSGGEPFLEVARSSISLS